MRKVYANKEDCCGCTACLNICPKQAIVMEPDAEGFLYPSINNTLCVKCLLCQSVCPTMGEFDTGNTLIAYALKHKDDNVRKKSSSGGAYTAISDFVLLKKDSVIYGVAYDDSFTVRHVSAYTSTERDNFRGSKYTQSKLNGVFRKIKYNLEEGRLVLFTGTPCQVAGLKNFLENSNVIIKNLILNDFVCHGTPSSKLWEDYVKFIEHYYKSKLCSYTFRDKEKGWRGYNVRAIFKNGVIIINTDILKTYINLFSSNLTIRPSCYDCKFKNLYRPSDITIADFWGIELSMPEFEDKENGITKGVSLVLINTAKGQWVFNQLKDNVVYRYSNIEDSLQENLKQPTKMPICRDEFWIEYLNHGFEFVAKKYAGYNFFTKIKRILIFIIKKLCLYNSMN